MAVKCVTSVFFSTVEPNEFDVATAIGKGQKEWRYFDDRLECVKISVPQFPVSDFRLSYFFFIQLGVLRLVQKKSDYFWGLSPHSIRSFLRKNDKTKDKHLESSGTAWENSTYFQSFSWLLPPQRRKNLSHLRKQIPSANIQIYVLHKLTFNIAEIFIFIFLLLRVCDCGNIIVHQCLGFHFKSVWNVILALVSYSLKNGQQTHTHIGSYIGAAAI